LANANREITEDPLVASARYQLVHADKRWLDNGLIWTKGKQLRIGVAPLNVDRACRFMAALLLSTRRRGYRIEVNERDTLIHIGYQPLPIFLRERTRKLRQTDRGYASRGTQFAPSGTLYLHMAYRFKERDWKVGDGAMPDEAESMLDRLEAASERIDEYYRALERRWAEMAAREKTEKELAARRETELSDFKKLLREAERWQKANMIREYIQAVESRGGKGGEVAPVVRGWAAWASAKANWYDPRIGTADEWLENVDKDLLTFKSR
jgi:hypothetical protein